MENLAYFQEELFCFEESHPLGISYFKTGRKILLKLKVRFSWSAAETLLHNLKNRKKKILLKFRAVGTFRIVMREFKKDYLIPFYLLVQCQITGYL